MSAVEAVMRKFATEENVARLRRVKTGHKVWHDETTALVHHFADVLEDLLPKPPADPFRCTCGTRVEFKHPDSSRLLTKIIAHGCCPDCGAHYVVKALPEETP